MVNYPLCCATMCSETSTHQHCLQTMLIQTITQLNIVGREKYLKLGSPHTSYMSILVHRRIIEVYKKYTKKLSELATK